MMAWCRCPPFCNNKFFLKKNFVFPCAYSKKEKDDDDNGAIVFFLYAQHFKKKKSGQKLAFSSCVAPLALLLCS